MKFFVSIYTAFVFCLSAFGTTPLWAQESQADILETLWVSPATTSLEEKKEITIAVLQDGPSPYLDRLVSETKKELNQLMGEERKIHWQQQGYNARWQGGKISVLLNKALNDANIDMIFVVGILGTQAAASTGVELTKPVVASLIERSEILSLPVSSAGKSRKDNFTFVVLNLPVSRDFKEFHQMISFSKVSVLVDEVILKNLHGIRQAIPKFEEELGFQVQLIPGSTTAASFLNRLGPATEAVMVGGLPRLPASERAQLIAGINQRRIPSFSLVGYPDVEQGMMAGLVPETFERTARRAALDLQQILLGFPATDLSVLMPIQTRLLINGKTARMVGYSPDYITLRTANVILGQPLAQGQSINLEQAISLAGQRNLDVRISEQESEASQQQSLIQRSFLLPQGESFVDYTQVDRDRAVASLGALPQRQTTGNLLFSQVLFDDELWTDYRSARREFRSAKYLQDSTRLDSMLTGGTRFIELLSTLALLRIEGENLSLTQDNLEMARLRFDVGMSGLDEVYRWEAQEAQQRGLVFQRVAEVQNALVGLNQTLNFAQDKLWNAQDVASDEVESYYFDGKLGEVIKNPQKYRRAGNFMVAQAFENSPELKSFQEQIEAESITHRQRQRRFYTPSFGTSFQYTREFQETTPGALTTAADDPDVWTFNAQARLPLFQGGRRVHEMNQVKANLKRLQAERVRAFQLIEQETRNQLNDVSASRPNLYFTSRAANRAKLNLGIIQEKYSQGTVGILDLLDAQNEYITRQQEAALAVYQYLNDLIQVQRAIGWFYADHNQVQQDAFIADLEVFMKQPEASELGVEKNVQP